ncbi:MAG: hypothetical protein ABIY52_05060 [Gemmatimonadaceae bacterium]
MRLELSELSEPSELESRDEPDELDDPRWPSPCEPDDDDDALRLEPELDCPSPCDELPRSRLESLDESLMPLFWSRGREPLFELFC